jgi:hypothetical protein
MSAGERERWQTPAALNVGRESNLSCGSSKGFRRLAFGWATDPSERNSISFAGVQDRDRRRRRHDARRQLGPARAIPPRTRLSPEAVGFQDGAGLDPISRATMSPMQKNGESLSRRVVLSRDRVFE